MAQQLLNAPEVGAAVEEVRGEAVSEGAGRDRSATGPTGPAAKRTHPFGPRSAAPCPPPRGGGGGGGAARAGGPRPPPMAGSPTGSSRVLRPFPSTRSCSAS